MINWMQDPGVRGHPGMLNSRLRKQPQMKISGIRDTQECRIQ